MSPCPYFRPTGFSRMATLAILPALLRKDYEVIGMAEMPKSDGVIFTTDGPVETDDQKALGLKPLEDL